MLFAYSSTLVMRMYIVRDTFNDIEICDHLKVLSLVLHINTRNTGVEGFLIRFLTRTKLAQFKL